MSYTEQNLTSSGRTLSPPFSTIAPTRIMRFRGSLKRGF